MIFKNCNSCGQHWESRDDFLSDPDLEVVGYQTFFSNLKLGLFLFNHSCDTTLAIEADVFLDLYKGEYHDTRVPVKDVECPGRCLNKNILSPCSSKCKCAFVSTLLGTLKHWEKAPYPIPL